MGPTLDDLLDATGLSEMRSSGMRKTAGEGSQDEDHEYFLKLADRCERAATQAPIRTEVDRELQEKTAAVAVIAKTLGEIEALSGGAGEKVAFEGTREARFIAAALANGHRPEEIAAFLKQAALSEAVHKLVGRARLGAGKSLEGIGGLLSEKGKKLLTEPGATAAEIKAGLSPVMGYGAGLATGKVLFNRNRDEKKKHGRSENP
jgi:hypothetical protein